MFTIDDGYYISRGVHEEEKARVLWVALVTASVRRGDTHTPA